MDKGEQTIAMELFSRKCPRCGSKLTVTGYAWPHPYLICENCTERNEDKKEREQLKKRLAELESQLKRT